MEQSEAVNHRRTYNNNGQKIKANKWTPKNDLQNPAQKTKDYATWTQPEKRAQLQVFGYGKQFLLH